MTQFHRLAAPALLVFATLAAGCNSSGLTGPIVAYGALVTVVPDNTHLAPLDYVVTVANGGTAAVYIQQCGDSPWLLQEEWIDGEWARGPEPDCAVPTVKLSIAAAGAEQYSTGVAAAGRYRIGIRVSPTPDMANMRAAFSAAFDAK